jgi:Xaa-Pro aminopeptidase
MSSPATEFLPLGFSAESRAELASTIAAAGLSALLLTSPENIQYTTGYPCLPGSGNPILYTLRKILPPFAVVTSTGEVILGCWGFSAEGLHFGADRVVGFASFEGAREAIRATAVEVAGHDGRLGVEATCPLFIISLLRQPSALGREPEAAEPWLEQLRLLKSPAESSVLRRATAISEQTLAEVLELVTAGVARPRLVQEAKERLMRHGATGVSHITMSFGANPEVVVDETLAPGSLATLDVGGIVDGYCADVRRYAFAGQPSAELLDAHALMVEIVEQIGEALLPGTAYAELFALATRLVARSGLDVRFNHIGHNIGLETEEEWLIDDAALHVKPGMMIAIELYAQTREGFRIGDEETYAIGTDAPERISQLPRELRLV